MVGKICVHVFMEKIFQDLISPIVILLNATSRVVIFRKVTFYGVIFRIVIFRKVTFYGVIFCIVTFRDATFRDVTFRIVIFRDVTFRIVIFRDVTSQKQSISHSSRQYALKREVS